MINYTTVFGKEDYRAVMTPHTEWYFTTPKRISNKGFVVTDGYLIEYAGDNYFSLHALYSKLAHGNPMHRFSKIIKRKSDGALLEDLIREHLALKDLPKVADEKEEESKVKFNSVSDVIKNLELQQMAIKAYKDFDAFNIKTIVLPGEYADAAEKYRLFANSRIETYSEFDLNCESYYRIEIRNGYTKLLSENFSMLFTKSSSAGEFYNQRFSVAAYYGSTEKELPDISDEVYFYSTNQAKTKTNEIYIYKEPTESLLVDSFGNITKRRIGLALN